MANDTYKDILVDADALIALAKKDDSNHKKALEISNKLQSLGVIFYISIFTIAEAATVISHKISQGAAKEFLKTTRILDIPILELPEKYHDLTDKWFFKQNKKGTSYFDCYNMAILERYKLDAIFTFDKIYKKNGFKVAN